MKHYTFVDYATQIYAAFVGLLVLFFHNATVPRWGVIFSVHASILIVVHTLILLHASGRGPVKALDFLRHFYPVLLYIWFFYETGWLNRMFFPEFLDPVVIRWDQAIFGFQPSVEFMEKLPWLPVSELFYASYFSYYVMIVGIGLALFLRNRSQFFHYLTVISFIFYICYTIYVFIPVIGPRVFFREVAEYTLPDVYQQLSTSEGYPEAIKVGPFFRIMKFIYRVFESPGAAIPSSHVAVAIVTVFFSFRYLRPIRYPHLVVAALLCMSTVYCRYHYAVDVFAGMITAALLLPLANYLYFRLAGGDKTLEGSPHTVESGKHAS
jgi:membrane-associated phospholipid phosphatase